MSLTPVPIDKIHPDRHNIREDLADVEALAESIKAVGLLQPLVVRPRVGGGFTIIDGHRRYQAALVAGLPALPCLMSKTGRSGGGTEVVVMLAAAMHQALTPIEAARAFGKLERRGMTPGEIARATGYSARTVRDRLALLHLPAAAQRMVENRELSTKDATALAREVRAKGTGTTTTSTKPAHFNAGHPQYATVRAICVHRSVRRIVGNAGCGQCWEAAIRDDEARQLREFREGTR